MLLQLRSDEEPQFTELSWVHYNIDYRLLYILFRNTQDPLTVYDVE